MEKLLSFIRNKGPVLPVDVARFLETNTLFASAHLSELLSKGLLKISSVKVGGSPLYYTPGQEPRLQEYSNRLHEKEQRAYQLLKSRRVLKDSEQDPVVRYALRQIKDFAKPVKVKLGAQEHLFWRWYLTQMSEVETLIKQYAQRNQAEAPIEKSAPKPTFQHSEMRTQTKLAPASPIAGATFLGRVEKLFEEGHISVVSTNLLKKGRHASYIVQIPSIVGKLEFYAEAKSKKRLTESDLSEALVRGNSKRLPVLLITDGKLSKKTQELLSEDFKGLVIKYL